MPNQFFDNTKVSTHRNCPRKYYYRHVEHLQGDGKSPALSFGLGWHDANDVMWAGLQAQENHVDIIKKAFLKWHERWTEDGFPGMDSISPEEEKELKARTPTTALQMIEAYVATRGNQIGPGAEFELIAIELPFAVPIYPDREDIWYCGRLDKVVRDRHGGIYIIDHKTTAMYKREGGFRAAFLDSWSPDSQMDGYAFAAHMLYGDEFKGVYIDGALVHKTQTEFCMIPVRRGIEQLDCWLWETRKEIESIKENMMQLKNAQGKTFMPAFEKHTDRCFDYAAPCIYTDLCKGSANPYMELRNHGLPMGFIQEEWSPFDVNKLNEIGMERD